MVEVGTSHLMKMETDLAFQVATMCTVMLSSECVCSVYAIKLYLHLCRYTYH